MLGYENRSPSCDKGYIAGCRLSGNNGYLEIKQAPNSEGYSKEMLYK